MYKVPMATRQFTIVTQYLTFTEVELPLRAMWKMLNCGFCPYDQPHLLFSYKFP
jgi:hypothetical protein